MNRQATKITVRHHAYLYKNDERQPSYVVDNFEVGKLHAVPDSSDLDEVIEIRLSDDWMPHVEVEFKDWGEIYLTDHVIKIYFKNERYTEILREKREARELKDTTSKPSSLSKDLR